MMCHQAGGAGGVIGPNLALLGERLSPIEIATALWNHGSAMADEMRSRGITRPTFSSIELNDLIAFLASISSEPHTGPVYVLPGHADHGRALFEQKGCMRCHSVRGEGGTVSPDLATRPHRNLLEFAATMWNKEPRMQRAMQAAGIDVPQLEPADMADLVAYLASIQYLAERGSAVLGRRLLQEKGCLGCHSPSGPGATRARDLTGIEDLNSQSAVFAVLWNHIGLSEPARPRSWPTLSASDMADLVAYFETTRNQE
jgi:mono/diheme cytochrome c family protein